MHVGEMQKKLSQWATEDADRKITDLYSLLCNAEWLRVAHRHVNANQGRETAGIDGETMQRFNENLEANLETLCALLKAKAFEPVPVNRVYIPKPDGRKRPLGILTIRDRIVQEALRMILEPIWEANFSNRSYGFRPNRSTYDAIAYPTRGHREPLAANIYLDQLDKYMESKYLHLTKGARAWRRKQGKGNYLYARYADDFVVLCNGTKADAQSMKEELHHVLNGMGLTLAEEKTKITHITEGFQFLGYRIERSRGETGKMVPKVLIPASAVTRFRHKVREMLAPSTSQESLSAKIHALNSLIRGWCNYYRCTSSPSKIFGKLSHEIYWDMVHWLGRKYQVNTPTVLRRYLKGHNTFGTATKTLVMPRDIKAKKRLVRTWHNPYTGIERIEREHLFSYTTLWTGDEHDRPGAMDLREDMMLLKGTRCAIQGPDCTSHGKPLHPSEVEMDHIIPRAKFKDPTEADRMGNLQPTCTPCHRAKTQTDSQVLRRMR